MNSTLTSPVQFRSDFEPGKRLKVAVVDTGHANIRSVQRALEEAGSSLGISVARKEAFEIVYRVLSRA